VGSKRPSAREMLADELTRLRSESGLSLRQLADKLGWDHAHLHNMEHGKSRGSEGVIEALDVFYGTTPLLKRLWTLAKATPFRDKYQRYMDLESEARVMQQYSPSIIPGLLQTEAYARELLRASGLAGDELDEQVSARLGRQGKLTEEPVVDFRAIVHEAALRCPLSDLRAWRTQLAHLVAMAERPNVTVQVLRLDARLHGLTNTDTMILWQPKGSCVAYTETGYSGDLAEDPGDVERLRLAYDHLRDLALSPRDSVAFIQMLLEDIPCDPPERT
jgi:transcriptional regulator with XRE-family HTH domain